MSQGHKFTDIKKKIIFVDASILVISKLKMYNSLSKSLKLFVMNKVESELDLSLKKSKLNYSKHSNDVFCI